MKIIRFVLKLLLSIIITLLLLSGGLLAYLSLNEFKPFPVERLPISGNSNFKPGLHREFSLLSWNIGYCGMSKEMDFFYDGGKAVRPSLETYQKALNGVIRLINHSDTLDFLLLQEVDIDSRRSYFTNQVNLLSRNMCDFNTVFATNYDAKFIPFPIFEPLSKVTAGILTFCRFSPFEALRLSSPYNFSWPKRLFFLNRCFSLLRIPIDKVKSLVVINLHNSAWDEGAELRVHELNLLKKTVLEEFAKGNFVVAGGDWNQNPPGFDIHKIRDSEKPRTSGAPINPSFMPVGWKWVFDPYKVTNRDASETFLKGRTAATLIDFFLISPNIEAREVRTIDCGFENSDHNPVYLRIKLKEDSAGSIIGPPPQ